MLVKIYIREKFQKNNPFSVRMRIICKAESGNRPLLKLGNETMVETIQEEFLGKMIAIESGVSFYRICRH